jgi:hypothetical protein
MASVAGTKEGVGSARSGHGLAQDPGEVAVPVPDPRATPASLRQGASVHRVEEAPGAALEVTLGRTGHTPEPRQNRRPRNQTRVRSAGLGGGRYRRLGPAGVTVDS